MAIGKRNISVKAAKFDFTKKKTIETETVNEVQNLKEDKEEKKSPPVKKKLRFGENKVTKPIAKSEEVKESATIFKIGNNTFDMKDGRYGRKKWPPLPGSSYDRFLEWATDDSEFIECLSDEDEALAIFMWMGKLPHPGEKPENFIEDIENQITEEDDSHYGFGF